MDTTTSSTTPPTRSSGFEIAVIRLVITAFGLVAAVYDGAGLLHAWGGGDLVGAGRALSAVGLGWMCGWYFTVRFPPTSAFLKNSFLILAGHIVASLTVLGTWIALGIVDLLGVGADRATFVSITAVTFAPVASYFATQLTDDRAVHLVCGVGIGALSYIVLFGVPG